MRTPLRRITALTISLSLSGAGLLLAPLTAAGAASLSAAAISAVNIRVGASASAQVVGKLAAGQRVTATGHASKGWVPVRFDGSTAYVNAGFVDLKAKGRPAAPTQLDAAGIKITTATLNVRTGPGAQNSVVTTLAEGSTTTMTGRQGSGYAEVYVGSQLGWVLETYLVSFSGDMARHTTSRTVSSVAHVRVGPNPKAAAVDVLAPDSTVAATGVVQTAYAQVIYRGLARWVGVRHLSTAAGGTSGTPTPTPVVTGDLGAAALAFAESQLGKPYKWGAVGPNSYDCSGLVLAAWKSVGVTLPRTSQQQFKVGTRIARADLRPGDLVFFYGPSPHHVGMYVSGDTIINAPRPGKNVSYTKISYMPYAGAVRPG